MIIAQIVARGASEYEKKSQRIDFEALQTMHEIRDEGAQVKHVYGPPTYAAQTKRFFAKRETITPFNVPEAVDDGYFLQPATYNLKPTLGSFFRPSVTPVIEQTMARIHRFREDVDWRVFSAPPSPSDIAAVNVWVDPAVQEDDHDGFVAEATAAGVMVVAARTPINTLRCEKGRTGVLVPPCDPNELTHAILSALFKPEVALSRLEAARQTVSKYRWRNRIRVLTTLYERLIA